MAERGICDGQLSYRIISTIGHIGRVPLPKLAMSSAHQIERQGAIGAVPATSDSSLPAADSRPVGRVLRRGAPDLGGCAMHAV